MTIWIRYGLMVLACGVLLASGARTQETNREFDGSPSRAELFALRLRTELGLEAALSAAAAPAFLLPTDIKGDAIFGIDVSHHNDENCKCKPGEICAACKIDWSRVQAQKVSFVYVKASQGRTIGDPTFEYHWRTLAQYSIKRGAYHFMSADADPIVQADNYVTRLEEAGKLLPTDMPPCLDLEADVRRDAAKRWIVDPETGKIRDFWSGQDPDRILEKVSKWLKRVEERTGRVPIIYTSHGWWIERIRDEKKIAQLQRHPIWIANYTGTGSPANGKPKVPNGQVWALWQFTESGRIKDSDIATGAFDINIFNGTLGALEQALGVAIPEKKDVASLEPPKDANTASDQAVVVNPNTTSETKLSDQVTDTNPNESKEPARPSDQVVNPNTPSETNPSDQVAGTNPSETKEPSKPADQVAGVNPNTPNETNPSDQVAGTNPSESTDSKEPPKPSDQVAGVNSNTPSESNNSKSSIRTPNRSRNSATRAAEVNTPADKTAADKVVVEKAATEKAPPMMVEIVLGNGRVLRVDANIDPTLLSRLVTAIDGK